MYTIRIYRIHDSQWESRERNKSGIRCKYFTTPIDLCELMLTGLLPAHSNFNRCREVHNTYGA